MFTERHKEHPVLARTVFGWRNSADPFPPTSLCCFNLFQIIYRESRSFHNQERIQYFHRSMPPLGLAAQHSLSGTF